MSKNKGGWYEIVSILGFLMILGGFFGALVLSFKPPGAVMERYDMDFWGFVEMLGFGIVIVVI